MTRCYVIDVDGEPVTARFSEPPNDQDQAALRELVRAARRRLAQRTPEQLERQELARVRHHERLERIRTQARPE